MNYKYLKMITQPSNKGSWAIGGMTLVGIGTGFIFLQTSVFIFVACILIGIGLGLVMAALIDKSKG